MKRQPSYVNRSLVTKGRVNKRKASRALDIFLGLGSVILVIAALVMALDSWGISEFFSGSFLNIDPLFWIDVSLCSVVIISVMLVVILFWLTVAFSILALVSGLCIVAALVMGFSGFSLLWPLMLLLLAAWGLGKSSQCD
ncbi:hypothetical protein [Shewanella violacea]|uniref:hypothetical protein n=1 Tax=Shewanella violacea TaxID=60217 RepID=UPI0012F91331|nr:hypothetical protein [Shewanella violacea]